MDFDSDDASDSNENSMLSLSSISTIFINPSNDFFTIIDNTLGSVTAPESSNENTPMLSGLSTFTNLVSRRSSIFTNA